MSDLESSQDKSTKSLEFHEDYNISNKQELESERSSANDEEDLKTISLSNSHCNGNEDLEPTSLSNSHCNEDDLESFSNLHCNREDLELPSLSNVHCNEDAVPEINVNRMKLDERLEDEEDKQNARLEEARLGKALGSISEYTKRIKHFIGLNSEDSDENSDTESAIDCLRRSTSKTEGNGDSDNKLDVGRPRQDGSFNSFMERRLSTESEENYEQVKNVVSKVDIHCEHTPSQSIAEHHHNMDIIQENTLQEVDEDESPMSTEHVRVPVTEDQLSNKEHTGNMESQNIVITEKNGITTVNDDFYEMNDDRTIPSDSFLEDNFPTQKVKHSSTVPVENMDPETVCGLWCFKPQWMQTYATAKSYLVFYSIIGILQGCYFTYLIGCLTTLEKRYAFKSKISGTIMMLDEITPLLLGILIGYFGGRAHRPRIVALGMFMCSLCCFISALPYFMYGPSQQLMASFVKNETGAEYCDREIKYENCNVDDRPPTFAAVACLLIGSFFKGFGNLAYYAVGVSYMDDNTKKKNTPIYLAICTSTRMLGPIIGFLMSSAFLKYYENPLGDPGYGPEDPRWIGAWWLGFVLQGILLFIFSFPILFFPRRLPRQRLRAFSNTRDFDIQTNTERIKGLVAAINRLLRNPVFTISTFGTVFSLISGYGYFTMLPKYLQIQFRLSASDASLLSGPPCITSSQVMTLIGGYLIYKMKPKSKALLMCLAITEANWIVGCFILMWPSCQNFLLAGSTMTEDGLQLQNNCNSECLCSTAVFNPVCAPDSISNYFSPCHAGCEVTNTSNLEIMGNCSCIQNSTGSFGIYDTVTRGMCPEEGCWSKAVAYVSILTVLSGINGIFRVTHTMILLRCVDAQDKSLALGLFETFVCGFAFIPLSIIFGALADAACLVWEKSCGGTGNCWVYDAERFNYLLHGMAALFTALALVCYIIVIFLSHRVKDLYEDELFEMAITDTNKTAQSQSESEVKAIESR